MNKRRMRQRRHPSFSDILSMVALVLGTLAVLAVGLSGYLWMRTDDDLRFVARGLLGLTGILLIAFHAHYWHNRHGSAFWPPSAEPSASFEPLVSTDARVRIERQIAAEGPLTGDQLVSLAGLFSAPASYRKRTIEEVAFEKSSEFRRVRIEFDDRGVLRRADSSLVLLARPYKGTRFSHIEAHDPGGKQLPVLGYVQTAAIVYQVCQAFVGPHLATATADVRDLTNNRLAGLIVSAQSRKIDGAILAHTIACESGKWADFAFLKRLLILAATRQPVFAISGGSDGKDVEFTFRRPSLTAPASLDVSRPLDGWRGFKELCRRGLRLPAKLVAIDISRCRSTYAYHLDLTVPPGLYIAEARVHGDASELSPMPAGTFANSYIGWSAPAGRSDMSLAATNIAEVSEAANPRLLIRIQEAPPGSLATAVLVAATVTLTTWLTGILSAPRAAVGSAGVGTIDLAALGLTLPGIATSWLGLRRPATSGAYRSMSGLVSLFLSAMLAVASVIAFVERFLHTKANGAYIGQFGSHRTFFYLGDWASAGIFGVALLNFCAVAGLFSMRVIQYLELRLPRSRIA